MKKEDIDKLIEESLNKEEAEFYHNLEEEGLLKQWGGLYKGAFKGWAILMTIVQLALTVITFYLGYEFFTGSLSTEFIQIGAAFFIVFFATSMLKLWHWMQMDKNSILREMKRIEFQIAVLSEKVQK
tara:strand:+ start:1921 stop:2301 length:381 start_codon:yes stop_codon:yes gene_type:complete